jgi:sensor histidine kinase regulating citrate/malate metabolism
MSPKPASSSSAMFKSDTLQKAIFSSASFSNVVTDAKGVIQIFNVGAEKMLVIRRRTLSINSLLPTSQIH